MRARDRLGRFFDTRTLQHHRAQDGAQGGAQGQDATKRAARLAAVVAAGLAAGACATQNPRLGTGPEMPPAYPEQIDRLAETAAEMSGSVVTYSGSLDPARAIDDIVDFQASGKLGGGFGFPNDATRTAAGQDMAAIETSNALMFTAHKASSRPGNTLMMTTYCIALGGPDRAADMIPTYVGMTKDHAPNLNFADPTTLTRFNDNHELGGHCSDRMFEPNPTPAQHHQMEMRADVVGTLLTARHQGHTDDMRKIADLRALGTYYGAEHLEKHAAERAKTQETSPPGKIYKPVNDGVTYTTAHGIDAAADFADQRLSLPAHHPKHLRNMPLRQVISEGTRIAGKNQLPAIQLDKLRNQILADRDGHPKDPRTAFAHVTRPADPAIARHYERIAESHARLYGPETTHTSLRPASLATRAADAAHQASTAKPAKPAPRRHAGLEIGG